MTSLDAFAERTQLLGSIAFVKIDVQGYELPVCQGMTQILRGSPEVVVCVEFEPKKMLELGFSPEKLLRFFHDQDFFFYRLDRRGVLHAVAMEAMRESIPANEDYYYLLFSKKQLA